MVGQRSSRSGWTIPGEFKGLAAKTTFDQHKWTQRAPLLYLTLRTLQLHLHCSVLFLQPRLAPSRLGWENRSPTAGTSDSGRGWLVKYNSKTKYFSFPRLTCFSSGEILGEQRRLPNPWLQGFGTYKGRQIFKVGKSSSCFFIAMSDLFLILIWFHECVNPQGEIIPHQDLM